MKTNSKKKKTKKEYTKQDKVLFATFIGLIILVAVLGVVALNMKNLTKNESSDIVIPVLEENSESEISVEVSDMQQGDTKEYIFVVSNYKGSTLLDSKITYDVDITPTESTSVEVYKNDSSDNLITETDLLIENNQFENNKKTEDSYKVIIKAKNNPKEQEKITIKINS